MRSEQAAEIDACMQSWRQGDVILSVAVPFLHLADLRRPTTPQASKLALEGNDGIWHISTDVPGLVVVTQTCDLVRSCTDRPYVEVSPLVQIGADDIAKVQRFRVPRYLPLRALGREDLAADLDQVMTVEKGLLIALDGARKPGVNVGDQARELSEALGRKRLRAAFPDLFVKAVNPMRERVNKKHGRKESAEGKFLRTVKEIRVRAIESWAAEQVEVEFLFLFERETQIPSDAQKWIGDLVGLVKTDEWLVEVSGRPVSLTNLTAATYLSSDRLDLDFLSISTD